jgi:hypothetical protein
VVSEALEVVEVLVSWAALAALVLADWLSGGRVVTRAWTQP